MRLPVFLASCVSTAALAFGAGHVVTTDLPTLTNKIPAFAAKPAHALNRADEIIFEIAGDEGNATNIAVAKHEVTFGEWQACLDAGACRHAPKRRNYVTDDHPVSGVSWHDVQQYIAWKSNADGVQYRLPLKSEWRTLAVNVLDEKVEKLFEDPRLAWAADYANFSKRADRRIRPVGHFGTEENGVADIAGNVWEWTSSCWRSPTAPTIGETNKNCGGVRVLAGVHMTYQSELIRVVPTGGCSIGFPPANIGFRLVRDIDSDVRTAAQNSSPLANTPG